MRMSKRSFRFSVPSERNWSHENGVHVKQVCIRAFRFRCFRTGLEFNLRTFYVFAEIRNESDRNRFSSISLLIRLFLSFVRSFAAIFYWRHIDAIFSAKRMDVQFMKQVFDIYIYSHSCFISSSVACVRDQVHAWRANNDVRFGTVYRSESNSCNFFFFFHVQWKNFYFKWLSMKWCSSF